MVIKANQGIIKGVLVMEPGMSPESMPHERIRLTNEGVAGDSHAGLTMIKDKHELANTRQVSLVSEEELQQISAELEIEQIKPEWIGANILLSGIADLSKLSKGTKLHFTNGAMLIVEEANSACSSAGRAVQAHSPNSQNIGSHFPKAALGRRGLLAWVKYGGEIWVGDAVKVHAPGE